MNLTKIGILSLLATSSALVGAASLAVAGPGPGNPPAFGCGAPGTWEYFPSTGWMCCPEAFPGFPHGPCFTVVTLVPSGVLPEPVQPYHQAVVDAKDGTLSAAGDLVVAVFGPSGPPTPPAGCAFIPATQTVVCW